MKMPVFRDPYPYVTAIKRLARILNEIEEREKKKHETDI